MTRKLLFVAAKEEYEAGELLLCPNLLGKDFIMDREAVKKVPFVTLTWEAIE